MIRFLLLTLILFSGLGVSAQTTPSEDMSEGLDQIFSEIQLMMDSLDFSKMLGDENLQGYMKGFNLDGTEMEEFNKMLDSLDMGSMFGAQGFEGLFEGMPGMEGMDSESISKMMEESMKMFDQMDISEMNKLFEQMDMSEMGKMLEGMDMENLFKGFDMEDFNKMFEDMEIPMGPEETQPAEGQGTRKKLKKI